MSMCNRHSRYARMSDRSCEGRGDEILRNGIEKTRKKYVANCERGDASKFKSNSETRQLTNCVRKNPTKSDKPSMCHILHSFRTNGKRLQLAKDQVDFVSDFLFCKIK